MVARVWQLHLNGFDLPETCLEYRQAMDEVLYALLDLAGYGGCSLLD